MVRIARFYWEGFLGFFEFFGRRPPIRDAQELADFIDQQSAFVTQKGIYEYSRARAGHYSKVLFNEPEFVAAVEQSRWRAYPISLAMVAEVVEGVLCQPCSGDDRRQFDALRAIVLSVFDRYPLPEALGTATWSEARLEFGAPPAVNQPTSARARHRHLRNVREDLFRPPTDSRKAASERLSDHVQLSQGDALQHS